MMIFPSVEPGLNGMPQVVVFLHIPPQKKTGIEGISSHITSSYLVGDWTNPFEKYAQVKLDHFPRFRVEHKKNYLKPPVQIVVSYVFVC